MSEDKEAISISRENGMVVLTMTPQRAQLVAASIWLGEGNHRGWLDDLSMVMEFAAEGSGIFAQGGVRQEASDQARRMTLDLPLPRDAKPVSHDPDLDTLFSPASLAAAMVSPTNASVASALRAVTVHAAMEAKEAIAEAAATTARAAKSAQAARAIATADAAEAMAEVVSRTAAAVKLQAQLRAAATRNGTTPDAAAAETLAQETDLAAVAVARAAAEAAMEAATAAADAAMELELEVATTAANVAAVAEAATLRLATHAEAVAHLLEGAKQPGVVGFRGVQ